MTNGQIPLAEDPPKYKLASSCTYSTVAGKFISGVQRFRLICCLMLTNLIQVVGVFRGLNPLDSVDLMQFETGHKMSQIDKYLLQIHFFFFVLLFLKIQSQAAYNFFHSFQSCVFCFRYVPLIFLLTSFHYNYVNLLIIKLHHLLICNI